MTHATLRVGLVGANPDRGWACDAHAPAIASITGLTISAVSARTMDIAARAAAAFGGRAYDDSLALIYDPDVDIISVCVKVPEHFAIVMAALEAGKHVYCEWPLGRDSREAQIMADAARSAKGHVIIGLQGGWSPAIDQACSMLDAGNIGTVQTLNMISPTAGWGASALDHHAYLQDKSNGATLLSIAGGHSLAAIERLMGPYQSVSVTGSLFCSAVQLIGEQRTIPRSGFDHMLIVGRHTQGEISVLELIGGTMNTPFQLAVRGSHGTLSIGGGHVGGYQAGTLVLTAETGGKITMFDDQPVLSGPPANVAALYRRFLHDIRTGTRRSPDFQTALRLHHLLDRIETAAATGQNINI